MVTILSQMKIKVTEKPKVVRDMKPPVCQKKEQTLRQKSAR